MTGRLDGKAVVTVGAGQTPGSTVGIGRAIALLFAREGARMFLVDRDHDGADETRHMIESDGGTASVHVADITDDHQCGALTAAAVDQMGRVDVVVNSVGILGPGAAAETPEHLWETVMDVNLKGMWMVAKHVLPIMVDQRAGSIVAISSIGAHGGGTATAYGVSKAGVNRLVRAIAAGYAQYDVRANAIMPGIIDTPMAVDATVTDDTSRQQRLQEREAKVPMTYKGSAWELPMPLSSLPPMSRGTSVACLSRSMVPCWPLGEVGPELAG